MSPTPAIGESSSELLPFSKTTLDGRTSAICEKMWISFDRPQEAQLDLNTSEHVRNFYGGIPPDAADVPLALFPTKRSQSQEEDFSLYSAYLPMCLNELAFGDASADGPEGADVGKDGWPMKVSIHERTPEMLQKGIARNVPWYEPTMCPSLAPMLCPDLTDGDALAIAQGGATTLMIRNVPGPYTPNELFQEWPNNGTYDFLYLPYSNRTQKNLTYVFINFTSPKAALDFKCHWQKTRLVRYRSKKPLNVGVAEVQGRDENLRHLRKKRLLHARAKQCQPIVFRSGVHIPLDVALAELEPEDAGSGAQSFSL